MCLKNGLLYYGNGNRVSRLVLPPLRFETLVVPVTPVRLFETYFEVDILHTGSIEDSANSDNRGLCRKILDTIDCIHSPYHSHGHSPG